MAGSGALPLLASAGGRVKPSQVSGLFARRRGEGQTNRAPGSRHNARKASAAELKIVATHAKSYSDQFIAHMRISIQSFEGHTIMRLKHLVYLLRTGAPASFLFRYALDQSARRQATRQHAQAKSAFREKLKTGKFSDDWFSPHVPHWLKAFEQCSFKQERPLRILEVGSFEGMATSFLMQHFPNAHITSVDTWDGSDEHELDFRAVEQSFDFNLKPHAHRLSKFKGESHLYFATEGRNARFDLIYVDGSHFSDDVLIDAVNAFNHLENGGLLIFDDYLWRHYPRRRDNPAAAINLFLKFNAGLYDLLQMHSQVFIRKTGDTQTHRKQKVA